MVAQEVRIAMALRTCLRHGKDHPCTCAMGNLYRFVEPVLLFLLRKRRRSYGYELATELRQYALTDAEIEVAALYRTLRQLEKNGCVASEWEVDGSGPARRLYKLTSRGKHHLEEWVVVLDHLSQSMTRFIGGSRSLLKSKGARKKVPSSRSVAIAENVRLGPARVKKGIIK